MIDVAVSEDGTTVWLVGTDGTAWTTHDGKSFEKLSRSGFVSVSVQGSFIAYFVGPTGTIWVYEEIPIIPLMPPRPPPPRSAPQCCI